MTAWPKPFVISDNYMGACWGCEFRMKRKVTIQTQLLRESERNNDNGEGSFV